MTPTFSIAEPSAENVKDLGVMPSWQLTDLYPEPSNENCLKDLEKSKKLALAFEADFKGKLTDVAAKGGLADVIARYEEIGDVTGRVGSFSYLSYVLNTGDPDRVKFMGDTQQALTDLSSHLIFFELELNRVEDEVLDKAVENEQKLKRYSYWFQELRKARPFQLEDRVEELFLEKSVTGRGAWNRLFDETMASLTFEIEGEELSLEPTLNFMSHEDEAKREVAFHALNKTLDTNKRLFTHITNVLAKDKEISDRWRGFDDVADSRHMANSVERDVVDALETAVGEAYPRLSHRYYAMKAKWFGKGKLNAWDRNAPLPTSDNRIFEWENAKSIVLEAYGRFSPELADQAAPFFAGNGGWIDAPVREGKSPGAFAHPTVPSAHPFLKLNYMGKTRDVMTLAHELGHGVHQVLSADQGPLLSRTPLTLAETASVFGEMLTFRSLLENTTDPKQRFALLSGKVEDMLNTVVRQISFYSFERKVHTARRKGELRTEEINQMWMDVSKQSLGPSIELNDGYEIFWSYVPHFIHSPFYVYAYAFGDCLVNSLYAQYEKSSDGFAERYFELLKAGGSKHHSELLAPFGLDAKDPNFWSLGLSMIEGLIDELEQTQP